MDEFLLLLMFVLALYGGVRLADDLIGWFYS